MQRVKDPERFLRDLERPLAVVSGQPQTVTAADLEADAESFLAFASALGVKPPRPRGTPPAGDVVPSRPA